MDPMQRILLEVAYEATENAGILVERLAGSDTGCFVGCFTQDYDELAKRDAEVLPKYHSIGTGKSILSNRISFCLDLKGPSMTLDTACSSSLVALHLACQSLKTGECTSALVGATNLIISPDIMVGMTNLGFLSPDSVSYAFDSRANGYARGEGVAALVLKPLRDALRDGDVIRSVIRGTAVNSNGRTPGITMPSKEAQMSLMRAAYRQSGLENDLATTGYVEAHGTGTAAGDPVEAGAVGTVLGMAKDRRERLYVGSIKSNIGHLEGASGLAGLIKAILSVETGVIFPNIWFEKGNPNIDFEGLNIQIPTELVEWPGSGIRRASVNG
jgi:acyl transferase domain-containing protein